MSELSEEVLARLERDGYTGDRVELAWQADLRHEGQATELTVGFQPGTDAPRMMRERFIAEYLKTYGYKDETPVDLVKLRLIGRGLRDLRLDFAAISANNRPTPDSAGIRGVSFDRGQDFTPTPDRIAAGGRSRGETGSAHRRRIRRDHRRAARRPGLARRCR